MQGRKKIVSENQAKLDIISEFSEAINCATRTLIFCETVESSELIRDELVQKGVSVGNYHSRLTSREQENILDGLGSGRFKCVVAVRALDEGIDVPDIDFGIIISGSRQKRQMIQRMGRVLRKKIDNRNACFAIVYAEGTTEDPSLEARDEGNLSLIIDNADHVNDFSGNKITASSFAAVVSRSIFENRHKTEISETLETTVPDLNQDSLEEKKIIMFMEGKQANDGGDYLSEMWGYNNVKFDSATDFFHWMFPLDQTNEAVPDALVVSEDEIDDIRHSELAKENLLQSAERFHEFLDGTNNWEHLRNHNHQRISLVISSLRLLHSDEEADQFMNVVLDLAFSRSFSNFDVIEQWETC
jgi:hypothetical protein